jgi:hypothetical protein
MLPSSTKAPFAPVYGYLSNWGGQKECSKILARDYAEMRDMFFCESSPWNEILVGLKVLEMRINAPSGFRRNSCFFHALAKFNRRDKP